MCEYEYDYEDSRVKAFVIYKDNVFYGDTHFDCYIGVLTNLKGDYISSEDYDKYLYMDDSEIEKLLGIIVKGEICFLNNRYASLVYNFEDVGKVKSIIKISSFYHHKSNGTISLMN